MVVGNDLHRGGHGRRLVEGLEVGAVAGKDRPRGGSPRPVLWLPAENLELGAKRIGPRPVARVARGRALVEQAADLVGQLVVGHGTEVLPGVPQTYRAGGRHLNLTIRPRPHPPHIARADGTCGVP